MKIFVINLKESVERRAIAEKQLRDKNLDFEFFDALRGDAGYSAFFAGYDEDSYLLSTRRVPSKPEIGCYASHLALWRKCVELNEPIVILEDDFNLHDNVNNGLSATALVIRDLGFIRLHAIVRKPRKINLRLKRSIAVAPLNEFSVEFLIKVPTLTLCYAISPAVAQVFINQSSVLRAPVDKFLQLVWQHDQPLFVLVPPVVSESVLGEQTTIGDRSKKDVSGLAHWIRRSATRIKAFLARAKFNRAQKSKLVELRAVIGELNR